MLVDISVNNWLEQAIKSPFKKLRTYTRYQLAWIANNNPII